MQVFVYRSRHRPGAYIYLCQPEDFNAIPAPLRAVRTPFEFALEFELTVGRKLARKDADAVLRHLSERGFPLQLPSEWEIDARR